MQISRTAGTSDSVVSKYLLDIVVVTYHSWRSASNELSAMVKLARMRDDVHWIFVDNTGSGEDAGHIRSLLAGDDHITLHVSEENLGFAAGSNTGASLGTAKWIFFLNPDISITASALNTIVAHISGAKVADTIAVGQVTRGFAHTGIGLTPYLWFTDRPTHSSMTLIGPSGGAGIYLRSVFSEHGGFYEPLFAWGEDADLALRLERAGVSCESLDISLNHLGQHSVSGSKSSMSFKARLLTRNRLWVARRNFSPLKLILSTLIHAAVIIVLSPRNLRRGTMLATHRGYIEGLKQIREDAGFTR